MSRKPESSTRAEAIFRNNGGILRTTEALKSGIHQGTLHRMLDEGSLEKLSRGLYRLSDMPPMEDPDLVTVARRAPYGVVSLISALSYHNITTRIPHWIYITVPRHSRPPRIDYPPVRVSRSVQDVFNSGICIHKIDNVDVRIYNPEKTLADCFKHRYKIGQNIAVEALRLYRERMKLKVDEILKYARICRVEKVMRPYLEALL